MDELKEIMVPFVVHESERTRMERTNHRLWILCIALLVALLVTNAGWIYYESQWEVFEETTTQEVTQSAESSEGDAVNKFVGGDDYGESDPDNPYYED